MNKIMLCLALAILFMASCKKSDDAIVTENLPTCIEEILMDSISMAWLTTIQATVVDNKIHYWLNTGASQVDGSEFIVDEQCDTLCAFGGWLPSDCVWDEESFEGWQIVWQP